jgi:putative FmdB family regulatory protein
MPLYEYQCKKCERKFETLVSLRELDRPVKCPYCDSEEADRLISTFSASVGSSRKVSASCSTGST